MVDAVRSYHMILRRAMRECHGYEANLEGRACLAAFQDVGDAARWAMRVQIECAEHSWPDEIVQSKECPLEMVTINDEEVPLYCGFRVRMVRKLVF